MDSIDTLFQVLGGPAEFGRAVGISTEHAATMRRRKSIPVHYWPPLVAAADKQGVALSYEVLVELHRLTPDARGAA